MDFNDSIDSVVATDSSPDYNAASNIDPTSSSAKSGVTALVLLITASTLVSTLRKCPARKPFKCSIQNSRRLVLKEFLFLLGLPTIPMLIIYFIYPRLMRTAVNFRKYGLSNFFKEFIAKTHR